MTSHPPRKIAFSNTGPGSASPSLPTESADDSFGFYLDDDVFIAAVDPTEVGLGRPITPDERGGVFVATSTLEWTRCLLTGFTV